MKKYKYLKKCRLCQCKTDVIINLGNIPIGNNLSSKKKDSIQQEIFPLNINNCINCNHYQLGISIDPKILYAKNYTYLSGIGSTFIKHFENYSNWISKKIKLKKSDLILDIGSNDGTCLSFFQKQDFLVCGVDPADKPASIANENGIFTFNEFYSKKTNKKIIRKFQKKPSLITSHNVLAHIDNIRKVFINSYDLLDNGGYFCFEVGYFKKVLEKKLFDTVYHEHLDYHHANPLINFLFKIGFSIVEVSTNNIQGGTIRILCKKINFKKISPQVKNFINKERKTILFNKQLIARRIKEFKANLQLVCLELNNLKKRNFIIAYGAPTKAALIANILKLNKNIINFTIEDNNLKMNKFIPGTDIPIKSFSQIFDYKEIIVFVFAWNFENDIYKKLSNIKSMNDIKIKLILPLPEYRIYEI